MVGLGRDIRAGAAYVSLELRRGGFNRGLRNAQRRLRAFSAGVTQMGQRMVVLGAAITTAFAAAAKTFGNFEEQIAQVATLLLRPEKFVKGFTKEVRALSIEFGEATETVAGGLYQIISAAIPADRAINVLKASLKAARAGIVDTRVAADVLTTVLNAYKLEATEVTRVSDILFQVVRRGKTTMSELAPQMGRVAAIASVAGVSLEELGASIATITRNGVPTDIAITSLRQTIATFLRPTDEAARVAKQYGIELNTATLRTKGLYGVLQDIQGLPAEVISQIFPEVRALTGVATAMQDITGFEQDLRLMAGSAGATQKAFETMASTLNMGFRRAQQSLIGLVAEIGAAVADEFARFLDFVVTIAGSITDWVRENRKLVATLSYVGTAIAAVGVGLVALGVAGQAAAFVLGGIIVIFQGIGVAIGALFTPLGALVAGFTVVAAHLVDVTKVMGGAVEWLGAKFGALKDIAITAFNAIGSALSRGDIVAAAKILWAGLKLVWLEGTKEIRQLWEDWKFHFVKIAVSAWEGTQKVWANMWAGFRTGLTGLLRFLGDWKSAFVMVMSSAWENVGAFAEKTWNKIRGVFDDSLDVERLNQAVEAASRSTLDDIEKRAIDEVSKRGQAAASEREKIEKERVAAIRQAEEQADLARKRNLVEYNENIEQARENLRKAREEFQGLVQQEREATEAAQGGGPGNVPGFDDIINKLQQTKDAINQTVGASIAGTVGGSNVRALAQQVTSTRTLQRIADDNARTVEILEGYSSRFQRIFPKPPFRFA